MSPTENHSLSELAARVEHMEGEVRKMRDEFDGFRRQSAQADSDLSGALDVLTTKLDNHVTREDSQYRAQDAKITEIHSAIGSLADDMKEPMEVWRTAKYGARATTLLVAFVRWAVPVGVGLLIGYNALQTRMLEDLTAGHAPATKQDGTR